jgi:type II secretion system protein N
VADFALTRHQLRDYALRGWAYASFFVAAFVLSAYLTFPYDHLRDYVIARVEAAGKGNDDAVRLEIGALRPSFLTGAVMTDVQLTRRTKGEGDAEGQPSVLHFDEVTARVSPWSVLMRSPRVTVVGIVGEGELDATYQQDSEAQHIEAELDALDVGKLGLGSFLGVPLKGRATGSLDFTLAAEAAKTTGNLELKIVGLKIGDGKAKLSLPGLRSGMTLDEIDAGALDLAIKAQNGVAEISKLSTDGKDLKINGDGNLRLANPVRRSRPDVVLELKLSDAYKNKSDRNKALFEILAMQPEWQKATGPDGALSLHIAGTLQTPRATPGTTRRKRQ